jgi:alkylation response protein AidB-like acyl-CoA dehydrogenase
MSAAERAAGAQGLDEAGAGHHRHVLAVPACNAAMSAPACGLRHTARDPPAVAPGEERCGLRIERAEDEVRIEQDHLHQPRPDASQVRGETWSTVPREEFDGGEDAGGRVEQVAVAEDDARRQAARATGAVITDSIDATYAATSPEILPSPQKSDIVSMRSVRVLSPRATQERDLMSTTLTPTSSDGLGSMIFTEEHEALRASIRSFVDREIVPNVRVWEETTWPDELARKMGAAGLLGLSVPEEYGGQGGDYYTNLVLAEEMGRGGSGGLLMGMSVHTDMVMPPLLEFGTEEQKERWVPAGVSGETIFCLGLTEPDAGSDMAGIRTRAVRDGEEWVINGSKTYITNGHRAGMIMLLTVTDPDAGYNGFTVFLVPMDTPGVIREARLEKMGMHASDTALLAFADVRVPDSARLGEEGQGFRYIMWELQAERLIGASGCLAYARYAFDKTVDYAMERHTFGQRLGSHQAIRHKFAAMATKMAAAQQLIYGTAYSYANGGYPVREISMAKLFAAQVGFEVADECVQIHGGAGYMDEYDVSRVQRDIRLYRIGAGADEILLDYIGRSLGF